MSHPPEEMSSVSPRGAKTKRGNQSTYSSLLQVCSAKSEQLNFEIDTFVTYLIIDISAY
jgi:hypothetical protein